MREILFRGFYPCEDGDKTVYVEEKTVKGRWVEGSAVINGKEAYIHENSGITLMSITDKKINPNFVGFYAWKVLLSIVGQYTGLNDKNGLKIFEGDILLEKNTGYKAVVEWQHDSCRFLAMIINRNSENSPNFFYVDKGNDRGCQMSSNEIIGNIHEEETLCHANHS